MSRLSTLAPVAVLASLVTFIGVPPNAVATDGPAIYSSDMRSVLPLDTGDIVVGTTSGLVLLNRALEVQQTLSTADGMPGNKVYALEKGPDNTVWVGTDRGIVQAAVYPTLTILQRRRMGPVRALLNTQQGLFIGVFGEGIYQLKDDVIKKYPMSGSSHPAASSITSIRHWQGTLYAGTAGAGLFVLTGNVFRPANVSFSHNMIFALQVLDDSLFVGTIEGLFQLVDGEARLLHSADTRAFAVAGNALWIGTFGSGLLRLKNRTLRQFAPHAKVGYVNSLCLQSERAIVATGNGLRRVGDDSGKSDAANQSGIPSSDISATALVGNRLWVGTFDQGLGYLDNYPAAPRWVSVVSDKLDRRINALTATKTETGEVVWVGTDRGLTRIERQGDRMWFRHMNRDTGLPSNMIHAVARVSNDSVLVGTGRNAAVVNSALDIRIIGEKNNMPGRAVWAVAEDDQHCYLLGTTAGLFRKCPAHNLAQRYTVSTGHLADDWVTAIFTTGNTIFVGTYSHGVSQLIRTGDSDGGASVNGHAVYGSIQLGGGYINPGGLFLHGNQLLAATMGGLKLRALPSDVAGDAPGAKWQIVRNAAPGRDVTTITQASHHLIIGSRSGLGRF
ncbi:MAG: hypothetical protein JXX14_00605 [Deltaproteobacteria bacterium]|nr:hypothetical protein [Deltaproteobacteria bacterium]